MNFTHLKPKTIEEISCVLKHMSNEELFSLWDSNDSYSNESKIYEELKLRCNRFGNAKKYINFIENHSWFISYMAHKNYCQ